MRPTRKKMMLGSHEVRGWWGKNVVKYDKPAFATADSRLAPTEVASIGKFFSAVFEAGVRSYCFENQADRDRFLTKYRTVWSAKPCSNPIK